MFNAIKNYPGARACEKKDICIVSFFAELVPGEGLGKIQLISVYVKAYTEAAGEGKDNQYK